VINNSNGNGNTNYNEYYRNSFDDLYLSAEHLRHNKSIDPSSGLKFICNDFEDLSSNTGNNHHFVTDDQDNPGDPFFIGIGPIQSPGIDFTSNYLPARNIFAVTGSPVGLSLINETNSYTYFHDNPVGSAANVKPEIQSTKPNISLINVNSSYAACPTEVCTGEISDNALIDDVTTHRPDKFQKRTDRRNLLDDGSTVSIVSDIQNVTAGNVVSTYTNLLTISPWMSITALVELGTQENHFTNEMIKDLMVLNPHSSRSTLVQNTLDDRTNQLSVTFRAQIDSVKDDYTEKDSLEAEIAYHVHKCNRALDELTRRNIFLETNRIDSIVELLDTSKDLSYRYLLAGLFEGVGDTLSADSILLSIPTDFSLEENEDDYNDDYSRFKNIWRSLKKNPYDSINSSDSTLLDSFAQLENYCGAIARGILNMNGQSHISYPVYDIPTPGSSPVAGTIENEKSNNASVKIYPNPAKDNIFINFNGKPLHEFRVDILSIDGKMLIQQQFQNPKGEIRIPLTNLISGTYICQIVEGSKIIASKKFILAK
jgi:hypothetical protein